MEGDCAPAARPAVGEEVLRVVEEGGVWYDTKSVQYLTNGLAGNLALISKECPLL